MRQERSISARISMANVFQISFQSSKAAMLSFAIAFTRSALVGSIVRWNNRLTQQTRRLRWDRMSFEYSDVKGPLLVGTLALHGR
jgi:hypothetical protein